jgi:LemA protein
MHRAVEIVQSCQPDPATEDSMQSWARLHGAQAQFAASLAVARTKPLDAAAIHALAAADAVLQMAWLEATSEGSDVFGAALSESTRTQWSEARQHIRPAARAFAEAIQGYNTAIAQFPALLLARLFGFHKATSLPNDF